MLCQHLKGQEGPQRAFGVSHNALGPRLIRWEDCFPQPAWGITRLHLIPNRNDASHRTFPLLFQGELPVFIRKSHHGLYIENSASVSVFQKSFPTSFFSCPQTFPVYTLFPGFSHLRALAQMDASAWNTLSPNIPKAVCFSTFKPIPRSHSCALNRPSPPPRHHLAALWHVLI